MDEFTAGDNEKLEFTRKDSDRLVRIETELEGIVKFNNEQFKALHKKLDENLNIKDKVNRHNVWIKIFIYALSAIITAVSAAVAKIIFSK